MQISEDGGRGALDRMAHLMGFDRTCLQLCRLRWAEFSLAAESDWDGNTVYADLSLAYGREHWHIPGATFLTWELHGLVVFLDRLARGQGVPRGWGTTDDYLRMRVIRQDGQNCFI